MRRQIAIGLIVTAAAAATSVACVCAPRSDAEYRAAADVVFSGTPIARSGATEGPIPGQPTTGTPTAGSAAATSPPPSITWTFTVDHVVKGMGGRSLEVVTSFLNSCSYSFSIGHRYVVYARRVGALLMTSECSGTHALAAGESPFALRRVPVYLTAGSRLGRVIATTRPGEHPGRGALRLLLAMGHSDGAVLSSAIPPGTRLLRYSAGGGTVRVILSQRFAATPAAEMPLALAQVVFTASGLPGVRTVRVRTRAGPIAGYDRPLRRADFRRQAGAGVSGR